MGVQKLNMDKWEFLANKKAVDNIYDEFVAKGDPLGMKVLHEEMLEASAEGLPLEVYLMREKSKINIAQRTKEWIKNRQKT